MSKKTKKSQYGHSKPKRHPWVTTLKIFLILAFSAIILGIVAAGAVFAYYAKDAPELELSKLASRPSTKYYDSEGNVIATMGSEQRNLVQTNNIPVMLVNAVTSIEDHRFFSTRGVDPIRIAGAFLHNASGGSINGGSTLDMQLIKLSFFSTKTSDQNMRVKVQEAWMALELDQKWTKEQIFTAYVNKVNMANGYYGMGTAAEAYYGKSLPDLSIAQLALLAGMPQAPTTYNPYTNPKAATWRRNLVIDAMYKYGKITAAQEKSAIATPVTDGLQPLKQSVTIPAQDDNFLKQAVAQADQITGENSANAGLKVYTTLDSQAQQNLYNIVNTTNYVPFTDNDLQVASTLINVQTGAVVAQIGGRNQPADVTFGYNQAVQTDRDWGSAMKPLVDYGPAFENGIYTSTANTIADTGPYYYPGTSTQLNDWDNQYMGILTVKNALDLSRNIPAVKTLVAVGLDNSSTFLKHVGIDLSPLQWANAISSNTPNQGKNGDEYGASSEKMAAAYAAFSNGGVYTKPYYITKIVYPDGKEVNYKPERSQAMKATTAYVITDMLKGVLTLPLSQSVGSNANVPGLPIAGKTGTSNYTDSEITQIEQEHTNLTGMVSPDENFVGYTPQYSMAVWTGYKNRMTPIYGANTDIATDVFRSMMTQLYPDPSSIADWNVPTGITQSGTNVSVTN
nr:transglycosylase domain-containing protein [Lactococcus nasutitermitis]